MGHADLEAQLDLMLLICAIVKIQRVQIESGASGLRGKARREDIFVFLGGNLVWSTAYATCVALHYHDRQRRGAINKRIQKLIQMKGLGAKSCKTEILFMKSAC